MDLIFRRLLPPELKAWFDANVKFTSENPGERLVQTAMTCLGITEKGTDNHGKMVELFQSTIGKAEGEPWCLSFVQSCVAYVESFGAQSALFPTENCLVAWSNSLCTRPLEPKTGDLVIYRVGDTTKGHAAIVRDEYQKIFIRTVEGNTSPATGVIEREGDGVYSKTRPKKGMGNMKPMGYLRLFTQPIA